MKFTCPVFENRLFEVYKNIKYKESVNSTKLCGEKRVNKIRNNTVKVVEEPQQIITLGELLECVIADYVPNDTMPITYENILPALVRWGLKDKEPVNHDALKQKRFNARANARKCKDVLQDYKEPEIIAEEKEANLQALVDEYENEQMKKPNDTVSNRLLVLWVVLKKVEEIQAKRLKQEKEERELKQRADKYFKKIEANNVRFASKIERERIDLQDLYDLSKNNMRAVVNFVNNNNKGL